MSFLRFVFVQGDPVRDLVSKYLGEQEASKRSSHIPPNADMNESALTELLVRFVCYIIVSRKN